MEKEINIVAPEGYEICIKFKPVPKKKRWRDNENAQIEGYFINLASAINGYVGLNNLSNYNVFATEKQAKSAIAMARISQIMANDERFGGVVTDEEWENNEIKHIIHRVEGNIELNTRRTFHHFLAFHTEEQAELFLEENEDLVRDYYMLN